MTMQERGKLGGMARNARYHERAEALRVLLERGEAFKRAAWQAGMSESAARRWRQRFGA